MWDFFFFLVSAFATLHNEDTVASTVWYFHLMVVGSILEQAQLGPSKAAFTLFEPLAPSGGSDFS